MNLWCWDCRMRGLMVDGQEVWTSAEYVWTGIYGAKTFLCADCCARWRAKKSGGCKNVMSISAWMRSVA